MEYARLMESVILVSSSSGEQCLYRSSMISETNFGFGLIASRCPAQCSVRFEPFLSMLYQMVDLSPFRDPLFNILNIGTIIPFLGQLFNIL